MKAYFSYLVVRIVSLRDRVLTHWHLWQFSRCIKQSLDEAQNLSQSPFSPEIRSEGCLKARQLWFTLRNHPEREADLMKPVLQQLERQAREVFVLSLRYAVIYQDMNEAQITYWVSHLSSESVQTA
jgi:hypothetical protein